MPDLVSELLAGNGQHAEDSNLSRVQTPVIGPENFQSGIEPVKDTARVSLSHGVKWRLRGPRLRENVLLKLYSPPALRWREPKNGRTGLRRVAERQTQLAPQLIPEPLQALTDLAASLVHFRRVAVTNRKRLFHGVQYRFVVFWTHLVLDRSERLRSPREQSRNSRFSLLLSLSELPARERFRNCPTGVLQRIPAPARSRRGGIDTSLGCVAAISIRTSPDTPGSSASIHALTRSRAAAQSTG